MPGGYCWSWVSWAGAVSSCDVSSLIELLFICYRLQNSLEKKNFVLLLMHTTKFLPPSTAPPCSLSPSWDWARCPVYLLQRAGSWLPVRGLQQVPSTRQDPWQQLQVSTILILQVTHPTMTVFPAALLNSYHIKCGNCLKYECLTLFLLFHLTFIKTYLSSTVTFLAPFKWWPYNHFL